MPNIDWSLWAVLPTVVAVLLTGCKGKTIDEELAEISSADRAALDALLAGSGITARQLQWAAVGNLEYSARSFSPGNGRLVGLRLTDVPVTHPEELRKLTALRSLWLNGTQLTTVTASPRSPI